jgi:hypothetical protein
MFGVEPWSKEVGSVICLVGSNDPEVQGFSKNEVNMLCNTLFSCKLKTKVVFWC